MKTIKSQVAFAILINIGVIIVAFNVKDPLQVKYENCLSTMMKLESCKDKGYILAKYPKLQRAKDCMGEAAAFKAKIYSKTSGPGGLISRQEADQLQRDQLQFNQLIKEVEELIQQVERYAAYFSPITA